MHWHRGCCPAALKSGCARCQRFVQGIARHGDLNRLLQRKSFLRQEVSRGLLYCHME